MSIGKHIGLHEVTTRTSKRNVHCSLRDVQHLLVFCSFNILNSVATENGYLLTDLLLSLNHWYMFIHPSLNAYFLKKILNHMNTF